MRLSQAAAGCGFLTVFVASANVFADAIPGLFPTGSNGSGGVLPDGAADPHYAIFSSSNPNYNGSPQGTVVNESWIPSNWLPNTADARWISDNAESVNPLGISVVYRLTFDLTGFDPTTASIHGFAVADDEAIIRLNGVPIGMLVGFDAAQPFGANSGFLPGLNTLDFHVIDTAAVASGLLVTQIQGEARVPTPSSVALLSLLSFRLTRRRREASVSASS